MMAVVAVALMIAAVNMNVDLSSLCIFVTVCARACGLCLWIGGWDMIWLDLFLDTARHTFLRHHPIDTASKNRDQAKATQTLLWRITAFIPPTPCSRPRLDGRSDTMGR